MFYALELSFNSVGVSKDLPSLGMGMQNFLCESWASTWPEIPSDTLQL